MKYVFTIDSTGKCHITFIYTSGYCVSVDLSNKELREFQEQLKPAVRNSDHKYEIYLNECINESKALLEAHIKSSKQ